MKLPRRAAAVLAAFLMAVSLFIAPQLGRAVPIKVPVDYVPPGEGDPDTPDGVIRDIGSMWIGRLGFAKIGPFWIIFVRLDTTAVLARNH